MSVLSLVCLVFGGFIAISALGVVLVKVVAQLIDAIINLCIAILFVIVNAGYVLIQAVKARHSGSPACIVCGDEQSVMEGGVR